MIKALISIFILLFFTGVCSATGAVEYEHLVIRGFHVDMVRADLKDPHVVVTPVVAKKFPNAPEKFEQIILREDPTAAINGSFFCKDTFKPVGDVVIDGELVYFGGLGTAMAITRDNKVEFITVDKNRHMNWNGYRAVISCGPRLLEDGKIALDPKAEGFTDRSIFAARNRSAVGITKDNELLFVAVNANIYFKELAAVMKELGCVDAMNLDGGSSSGLYYKGEMVKSPKSSMPAILVINEKQYAPNALVTLKDRITKNEKRIDILSSVVMVIDKDRFLVKDAKDGKILLLMRFDNPKFIEAPQIGAIIGTEKNKFSVQIPFNKILDSISNVPQAPKIERADVLTPSGLVPSEVEGVKSQNN